MTGPRPEQAEDAHAIAQDLLDRTGQALMAGDDAAFLECFAVPTIVETFEGVQELPTPEAIVAVFHDMVRFFRRKSVTHIIRHVVSADFEGPDRVISTHESRLIEAGQLVRAPYPVFSTIDRQGAAWKITRSVYAIADEPEHARVLTPDQRSANTPPQGDRT